MVVFLGFSLALLALGVVLPAAPAWQMQPGAILGLVYLGGIMALGLVAILRRD